MELQLDEELGIPKCSAELYRTPIEVTREADGVSFNPSPYLNNEQLAQGTQEYDIVDFTKLPQGEQLLERLGTKKIVCKSDDGETIKTGDTVHSFLKAMELAWFEHHPIRLEPDQIWTMFLQSVAIHVSQNSEKLRSKFVDHDGQETISIERPSFTVGNIDSQTDPDDWNGVVMEFTKKLAAKTKAETVETLMPDFSTTTDVTRVACGISVMDALSSYFRYQVMGGCGFPKVTIAGMKSDWLNLMHKMEEIFTLLKTGKTKTSKTTKATKTRKAGKTGKKENEVLSGWKASILPVVQRFIDVFDGKVDALFWNSMLARGAVAASSGKVRFVNGEARCCSRDDYCGWIQVFFPYLTESTETFCGGRKVTLSWKTNYYCEPYSLQQSYVMSGLERPACGATVGEYPFGISKAGFILLDVGDGTKLDMALSSGFVGIKQKKLPSGMIELSPKIGWMVTY